MKKITDFSRTIIALATSLGSGSIAVIRISGPEAIALTNKLFVGTDLTTVPAKTIHYGKIRNNVKEIDQVLVSVFHSPHSYTGEDYLEISCHGNPFIVDDILGALLEAGAYTAGPGEFTLRAFLNHKLDLSQAEAVSSIIQAKSRAGIRNSLEQLNGRLAAEIIKQKNMLIDIVGLLEIDLDFAEEGLDVFNREEITGQLREVAQNLVRYATSFNYAKFLNDGIRLTIIGEPNAGKSTLLNQILGENRAITSHIPGTTRDAIHETIVIKDILFKISDTAGLRETMDFIEQEGIRRTKNQVSQSDLVILVVDGSNECLPASASIIEDVIKSFDGQTIIASNKIDLGKNRKTTDYLKALGKPLIDISAVNGDGIPRLIEEIIKQVSSGYETYSEEVIITSQRQKQVLDKSALHIHQAIEILQRNGGFEFASVDLRQALNELGEITGETVSEDILNRIFTNFCIGK